MVLEEELVKQQNGEYYIPSSEIFVKLQNKSRAFMCKFNNETDRKKRHKILKDWLKATGKACYIEPPFFCDFGCNLKLGNNVYFNTNCTVLDSAIVEVGDYTMIGSGVQICTPEHPLDAKERRKGLEKALPVKIGKDCWIGSGAIILSGVIIGDGTTIGAGSVVTKNIPSNCVAVGNPCKVIKNLKE